MNKQDTGEVKAANQSNNVNDFFQAVQRTSNLQRGPPKVPFDRMQV